MAKEARNEARNEARKEYIEREYAMQVLEKHMINTANAAQVSNDVQKLNGLITPPDFYCAYGERKE